MDVQPQAKRLIIGCGYLGRRVARQWVANGDEVWALTRSAAHADELRALGVHPIIGDVMAPGTLRDLPATDTVLHAVGLDRQSGRSQREVYVDGLDNVLRQIAPQNPTFIHVSSTSVYGQDAGEWVDETSACRPRTDGGRVCLEAEEKLKQRLPAARIVRLAGLYGPGRLIARADQLRSGAPLRGNPDAWLNLIHADDAASAVIACAQRERPGAVYLGSDDRPVRRREYFTLLAELIGAPPPRFEADSASDSRADGFNKRCRNARLRAELLVELRYPTIAEGLPASV